MFIRHSGKADGKVHFIVHGRRLAIPDFPHRRIHQESGDHPQKEGPTEFVAFLKRHAIEWG
jgi:hypothetical protein